MPSAARGAGIGPQSGSAVHGQDQLTTRHVRRWHVGKAEQSGRIDPARGQNVTESTAPATVAWRGVAFNAFTVTTSRG